MIKKSDSKSAFLPTTPILGQTPMFWYFSDCQLAYRYLCHFNFNPSTTITNIYLKNNCHIVSLKRPRLFCQRIPFLKMTAESLSHK